MWTLVLMSLGTRENGYEVTAMATISGFSSEQTCRGAGLGITREDPDIDRFWCVEVK
jgi:hypothetical protein